LTANSSKYIRPAEVDWLCGLSNTAKIRLNWYPKVRFKQSVKNMVDYKMEELIKGWRK
jgi:GDP-D-mannose dehydratase